MLSPFAILGLAETATETEIKTAYRRKAKKCHPDLRSDKEAATIEFKELTVAYQAALKECKVTPQRRYPPPPPRPRRKPGFLATMEEKVDFVRKGPLGPFVGKIVLPPIMIKEGGEVVVWMYPAPGEVMPSGGHLTFKFQYPAGKPRGCQFQFEVPSSSGKVTVIITVTAPL